MFCPRCRYEYVEGTGKCPDCKAPLVTELPPEKQGLKPVSGELVTVLSTMNAGVIAVAKSILEGAGIWYFAKGESLQNLFGLGGIGYNPISRDVEIRVCKVDEEVARVLLEDLRHE